MHAHLFRKLVGDVDAAARPGDLVAVETPQGELLGHGLFNPRAEIAVRMLTFGPIPPGIEFWKEKLQRAVELRRDMLKLDAAGDAYRVIHAEADGLPGLVIDRYGDVLSAEVFSLAMYQRSAALLECLGQMLGTKHTLVQIPAQTHGQEGFQAEPVRSPGLPEDVVVTEFGTRFRVRFEEGHKTGFFCDQRDNRRRLAEICTGRTVLDLCCYTGGFAVQAKRLGNATDVTAVDLDEKAIAIARENAHLNQQKINFVHADAFGYMRHDRQWPNIRRRRPRSAEVDPQPARARRRDQNSSRFEPAGHPTGGRRRPVLELHLFGTLGRSRIPAAPANCRTAGRQAATVG